MIWCGNCKGQHLSVADVRRCYGLSAAITRPTKIISRTKRPWRQRIPVPTNFEPEEPATVYLITHDEFVALKVGVTGSERGCRIADHEENGWELLETWRFSVGYDALAIEEEVLDYWRNLLSLPQAVHAGQMPQHGASETVADSPATRTDTIQLINSFHREASHDPPDVDELFGRSPRPDGTLHNDEIDPWELYD